MSTVSETCWTPEVQCISALHERTSLQLDGQTTNDGLSSISGSKVMAKQAKNN